MTSHPEYSTDPFSFEAQAWSVRQFISTLGLLIASARDYQGAYSYRNFHVRGAGLGVDPVHRDFQVYTAGNLKKDGQDKRCTEKKILGKARKSETAHFIAGLVIAATTDRTLIHGVTGVATPTLHPCPDSCIPLLKSHESIMPSTLVYTTGQKNDLFQVFTADALVDLYQQEEYDVLRNDAVRGRPNPSLALSQYDSYLARTKNRDDPTLPGQLGVKALMLSAK